MSESVEAGSPENGLTQPIPEEQSAPVKRPRLVSLDQLRGFTVASMFVVNFSGGLKAMPEIIKHHNVYVSLADWIMPTFMFMVGFSFRLSWLSTVKREGAGRAVSKFLTRGLLLVLVSIFLYAADDDIKIEKWSEISQESITKLVVNTLKANLWETLAIIGCAQMLVLPLIGRSGKVRLGAMFSLMLGHVIFSYYFNWNFVHGKPNFLDEFLGSTGKTAWDGGTFGLMGWASLMLAGSLVHDSVMNRENLTGAIPGLIFKGVLIAILGWGLSGLSRLYDVPPGDTALAKADKLADSPVLPDFSKANGRSISSLLAEPPLVPPPGPDQRKISYWMMYKKMVSLPFVVFHIGVGMAMLGTFMLMCDVLKWRLAVLERFGQNALAAYCIHHFVEGVHLLFVPKDSPAWWCWLNLILFMLIVDRCLAWMQRNKIRFTV